MRSFMANPVSMYAAEVEMSSVADAEWSQRADDELVPSGWVRRYSVEHGQFYYSNDVTKVLAVGVF